MRSLIAPSAPTREELLQTLIDNQRRLLLHLTASCGLSGRATVDLAQVARRTRMRSTELTVALLGLQMAGRVRVEHDAQRFETATITLPEGRITP